MPRRWHLGWIAWTTLVICFLVGDDLSTVCKNFIVDASSPVESFTESKGQKVNRVKSNNTASEDCHTNLHDKDPSYFIQPCATEISSLKSIENKNLSSNSSEVHLRVKRISESTQKRELPDGPINSNINLRHSSRKMFKRYSAEQLNPADENEADYSNIYNDDIDAIDVNLLNDEMSRKRNRLEDVYPEVLSIPQPQQHRRNRRSIRDLEAEPAVNEAPDQVCESETDVGGAALAPQDDQAQEEDSAADEGVEGFDAVSENENVEDLKSKRESFSFSQKNKSPNTFEKIFLHFPGSKDRSQNGASQSDENSQNPQDGFNQGQTSNQKISSRPKTFHKRSGNKVLKSRSIGGRKSRKPKKKIKIKKLKHKVVSFKPIHHDLRSQSLNNLDKFDSPKKIVELRSNNQLENIADCEIQGACNGQVEKRANHEIRDRYKRARSGKRRHRPGHRRLPSKKKKSFQSGFKDTSLVNSKMTQNSENVGELKNLLGELIVKVDGIHNLMSEMKSFASKDQNQITSTNSMTRSKISLDSGQSKIGEPSAQAVAPRAAVSSSGLSTSCRSSPTSHYKRNWGPWSGWSRCTVSCGQGFKSRTRRCISCCESDNEDEEIGAETEEKICSNRDCPPAKFLGIF